jgi:ELWxxDGT repeat protein
LRLEPLEPRALLAAIEIDTPIVDIGGIAYFPGRTDSGDFHLWRSDGTSGGTYPISEVPVYVANHDPGFFANVNGTLYFVGNDAASGPELWKSDGTAAGTVLVRDVRSGSLGSYPLNLTPVGGTLFFDTFDGAKRNLWKSDGTAAGTVLVKNITANNDPQFTNVNGMLFFKASDGTSGYELWKSDGSDAGTMRVKDIRAGSGSSYPTRLTNVNGTLLFTANDGTSGTELWKSDGTDAGTQMLADIRPGGSSSNPEYLAAVGGMLLFSANDGTSGSELWKSDGTAAGTQQVVEIRPGSFGSGPREFVQLGASALFYANSTGARGELWITDGTSGGTAQVSNPLAGASPSFGPANLTKVNGNVFFFVHGNLNGEQLWKSDGTAGGTTPITTFTPSIGFTVADNATALGGRLLFSRDGDGTGKQLLWVSDGTAAGTMLLDFSSQGGNHAPSFLVGPDRGAMDDDGPHVVGNWATSISPGAGDPATQKLAFQLNADHPEYFAAQPEVDASGKLTFTPALNAQGTAIVTIVLSDDGGTAGGGSDRSAPQVFSIQIAKQHPWRNSIEPRDVDNDTHVAANDAVLVINELNAFGSHAFGAADSSDPPYLDVDGDDIVAPGDALEIINWINAGLGGEGESAATNSLSLIEQPEMSLIALLAGDAVSNAAPRRRNAP